MQCFGKRSEVKDAHDRYANSEVACLLQRMEAFEGLAVPTTNMRQNLDPVGCVVDDPRGVAASERPGIDQNAMARLAAYLRALHSCVPS
jgi:hypothetical protein